MDKIKIKIANFLIHLTNKLVPHLVPYQKSYKQFFDKAYDKVFMEHASNVDINK